MISTICYRVSNPEEIVIITNPNKSNFEKWIAWNVIASSLYDFRFKASRGYHTVVSINQVHEILSRKDYIILEDKDGVFEQVNPIKFLRTIGRNKSRYLIYVLDYDTVLFLKL